MTRLLAHLRPRRLAPRVVADLAVLAAIKLLWLALTCGKWLVAGW